MAELYQVEFKGSRREYFYNTYHHSLSVSDYVIIQATQGEDMGLLIKRLESEPELKGLEKPRSILRRAGDDDHSRYQQLKENETKYKKEVAQTVRRHGLDMKIVDVECMFDGGKITFYFTADHRVDFRTLVRELASRYRTRIELRQIGVRDEAKRIDGYGICGLRQCCNGHLTSFAPISTQHAREQDLSLNPSKISGNCGRLLCCLRYEVDLYTETKRKFPALGTVVKTAEGSGRIQRIDIFREEAVFKNEDDVLCRVKPDEIKKVERTKTSDSKPVVKETNNLVDSEELRRLDDNSNNVN